jgi:hypothetical protein
LLTLYNQSAAADDFLVTCQPLFFTVVLFPKQKI